ncbi:hypothetical protein TCAL_13005 [Tigriopus californicus]|uniref:OTU domain-containing protein n=2 Tax=Tigriopus californicus TaxID=6832 RepID=A0A553PDK4_TIGCA|nr:hypothetical protein TCAL_13005 [Tigriopus californicus]|eukprot:TCALIF_13005-PA protein Name:"Similar to otud6b OTU domain-containing protein 6B (Xenopus laevis)" AED:0.06 eAED:0.06 QI:43/1/1/1/1/1/2/46/334
MFIGINILVTDQKDQKEEEVTFQFRDMASSPSQERPCPSEDPAGANSEDENDSEEPLERLLKSHRKERKDLQAQIQALKKSASKGDKKKRKDLVEEVATLERACVQRQEREIQDLQEALSSQCVVSTSTEGPKSEESHPDSEPANQKRVSKAQRRREKTAEKARIRLDAIEKQEEENKEGSRQKEIQAIQDSLRSRDLALYDISSDGDCLFAGVRHQLISKQAREMSIRELREGATSVLRRNRDDYLPFLIAMDSESVKESDPMEHYCHIMESTSAWGGDMEIRALSDLLETPIEIIQWQGAPIHFGSQFDKAPLVLTYHRHIYGLGAHYNSTI